MRLPPRLRIQGGEITSIRGSRIALRRLSVRRAGVQSSVPPSEYPMSEEILLREQHDGIVTLTLNRPRQMNALSAALRSRRTR